MKKLFFKTMVLLSLTILFVSCEEEVPDNEHSKIYVKFYDVEGTEIPNDILSNKLNLKINITPSLKKSEKAEISYQKKIIVPLDNNLIQENKKLFKEYISPNKIEEFTFSLLDNETIIYSKELRFYYKSYLTDTKHKMVTRVLFKNSEGKWVNYVPKKQLITKNGKGIYIQFKLNY